MPSFGIQKYRQRARIFGGIECRPNCVKPFRIINEINGKEWQPSTKDQFSLADRKKSGRKNVYDSRMLGLARFICSILHTFLPKRDFRCLFFPSLPFVVIHNRTEKFAEYCERSQRRAAKVNIQ